MDLQPLLNYLDAHAHQMDFLGSINPNFTSTGVAFVTDDFLETRDAFELPPLLLTAILKDYWYKANETTTDQDGMWEESLTGEDYYLMLVYGTDILVNHVLAYTRKRKFTLLSD